MASIKKLDTRKYKITVSNGYRPDGRKISRAKTITVPNSVGSRGIPQYVAHKAEEFEKLVKNGYCEDGEMTFREYADRWLERQTKYAPGSEIPLTAARPAVGGKLRRTRNFFAFRSANAALVCGPRRKHVTSTNSPRWRIWDG